MASSAFDLVLNARFLSTSGGINQDAVPWIILGTLAAAAGVLAFWPDSTYHLCIVEAPC